MKQGKPARWTRLILAAALAAACATPALATSVVADWNEEMLAAVRATGPRPTVVSRSLYIVSAAMYDAAVAYDGTALASTVAGRGLRRPPVEHTEVNRHRAVSYAAHRALSDQWPTRREQFDDYLASLGYTASDSTDPATPEGIGNLAAQAVLDARRNDGANIPGNYADAAGPMFPMLYRPVNSADPTRANAATGADFDASRWQPLRVPTGTKHDAAGYPVYDNADPASYADQKFLTPHWGSVTPFAAGNPAQYLPPRPPQRGSSEPYVDALGQQMTNDEAWNRQFDEVLAISGTLTDREKVIAEFWADGPRSETPPGHWNQLAQGISERDGHDILADARMFFALNAAVMDAGIVTWYVKRTYDFIRPVSAIRHKYAGQTVQAWAGPDLGTQAIRGEDWKPYQDSTFVTPPFAEFTSGHSGFSAAAAVVLTATTGSDAFFDGVTRIGKDLNGDGVEDLLGEHVAMPGANLFENSPAEQVVLRWPTFKDAADEAGVSRLYGGIHVQDGDLHGRRIGERVGAAVVSRTNALFAGNRPIEPGLGGAWYNPGRDGEGFTLGVLDDGRMTVTWYTYDAAGNQVWLAGAGDVDATGAVTVDLYVTSGPRFGSAYTPADLDRQLWGEAVLRFDDCDHGSVQWTPVASGFEAGSLALVRLTEESGQSCTD